MKENDSDIYDISIKFKSHQKGKEIIQGEPFKWGVIIKNIGDKPTPEGVIIHAGIEDLSEQYCMRSVDSQKYVRSLNPNEEIYIEIDSATSFVDGPMWAYLSISAKEDSKSFQCFQVDSGHNTNTSCTHMHMSNDANWMECIYIQKKMEILQARTNHYILILTILTSWEALFGINDTFKNALKIIKLILMYSLEGITYLIGMMK
ncbi:hypothetical protein [Aeromonas hydrophila]|uniref:hypothetical protein n=1 Tax=Aeromonas hydrophila TaxID=644 RepID=UPI0040554CFE